MRKTPIKKVSKQKISTIQRKIWNELKRIIRKKYPNTCYTCFQTGLAGSNLQTGHLWPKASLGAYLKYDMRVLRVQCFRCNIHLGGNGAVFYENMLRELGKEKMDQLQKDRQVLVKAYDHYVAILEEYKKL